MPLHRPLAAEMHSVGVHILIVEDNDMSFVLADHLLRRAGCATSRASDGSEGVRAALENRADLILCDLDLPVMDGYELLQALRANSAWRAVPVLAFTGDSAAADQQAVVAAGFTGYVFKPPDPSTFAATIARYVALSSQAV